MARVEIKSIAGAVLYAAEVEDSIPSGLQLQAALEKAASGRANLSGANLRDAYLRGADLRGADLRGAHLRGAHLRGANLSGADLSGADLPGADLRDADLRDAYLRGADLRGAYLRGAYLPGAHLRGADLRGANLSGADLRGAHLRGAKLTDELTLVGERPVISIGPVGSRSDTLFGFVTNQGLRVRTGCFFGAPEEFATAVQAEHGTTAFGREYLRALELLELHAELYPAPVESEAQPA